MPIVFTDNNSKFDQPEQISNAFNSYFTNIGPNLAAKIDSNICFTRYLKQPCENSLFFTPTHVYEIIDIVKSLKNTKSSGFDEISVYMLKQINQNIASICPIFSTYLS